MENLVDLSICAACFGFFLISCGFLWGVSIWSKKKEGK